MVESRDGFPEEHRESFEARLAGFSEHEGLNIMFAYDIAKADPRQMTLILLDECGIKDPIILQSSLLHDVLEDTSMFGNAKHETYRELMKTAKYRISKTFGPETAKIVISVSKLKGKDTENLTEEQLDSLYHHKIKNAHAKPLLVKMADKLHNLRTLGSCTLEKKKRKVKETEEFYLPLFEKVLFKYPKEGQYLLDQMKIAINNVSLNWGNNPNKP